MGQDVPKVICSPQVVVDKKNVGEKAEDVYKSVSWNSMVFEK